MIAVIGEALVDLVAEGIGEDGNPNYHAMAGGSPYNVSVASARLDVPTRLYSRWGTDAFGHLLSDVADRNGVEVAGVDGAAGWTGTAITTVDATGAASYDFRIDDAVDWAWSETDLARLGEASIIHFGSIAASLAPGDALIRAAVERAGALVTYDPNVRPALLGSRQSARQVTERNIAMSNLVKASDEDIAWLYPDLPVGVVAERWLSLGPELIVVTAGVNGATAYRGSWPVLHRPAFEVTVVDTVGAGDSGMATLLAGLHNRSVTSRAALAALTESELVSILDDALLAAALTCARRGADPPTALELASAAATYPVR